MLRGEVRVTAHRKWLSRRSWKSYVTWEQFLRLVARYPLPAARIVHRYS
jgi:hypothetical protein